MTQSRQPSDLRAIKTRNALTQALEDLLREKPLEKITVTDICNQAFVSRTAFYAHYCDKYELFHAVLTQRFDSFGKTAPTDGTSFEQALIRLLSFVRKDDTLCRRTAIGFVDFELAELVTGLLSARILEQIEAGTWRVKSPRIEARAAVIYVAYGTSGVVAAWLRSGLVKSEEEVAHVITLLLEEVIEPVES